MSLTAVELLYYFVAIQTVFSLAVYIHLADGKRSRNATEARLLALMKRIEGLTADKREQMLIEFDSMIDHLNSSLPETIQARASERILETEKKILNRLAEIDPSLRDPAERDKLDELVRSMEALERTLVDTTCQSVRELLLNCRKELFRSKRASEAQLQLLTGNL